MQITEMWPDWREDITTALERSEEAVLEDADHAVTRIKSNQVILLKGIYYLLQAEIERERKDQR